MKADAWIAAQRRQMQEKEGKEFWSDAELEQALADAAAAVQQDIPVFTAEKRFTTKPGVSVYEIGDEVIDGLSLKIAGTRYPKVSAAMFHALEGATPAYMLEGSRLTIHPPPQIGEPAVFSYTVIREQKGGDADIVLPRPYHEAMRRYFLFRVYEKQPDRKSRDLASYYLKLYEQEISKRKYTLNPRVHSARSGYRRV